MLPAEPPSLLAAELHWDEPDAGCVSCGKPYLTVADHRCGDCIGDLVRHCPQCLADIGPVIDREVVSRLRATSLDVSEAWVDGQHFERHRDRERVNSARRTA